MSLTKYTRQRNTGNDERNNRGKSNTQYVSAGENGVIHLVGKIYSETELGKSWNAKQNNREEKASFEVVKKISGFCFHYCCYVRQAKPIWGIVDECASLPLTGELRG